MSDERGSDTGRARKRGVLASLPGFLLKEVWRNDDLPAPPEPDRPPSQQPSWTKWLLEPERLPEPPTTKPMPEQTSFLRWLVSGEELPEPRGGGSNGSGPAGDPLPRDAETDARGPGLFGWLIAQESLPERQPTPHATPETSVWRRLSDVVTPTLVLGVILVLTFAADEPIRQGRAAGWLYVAAMLAAAFIGALVTARWLYAPAIGRKLALFYVIFGFLWLNLHLLLIHTNRSGGGIWPLLAQLAIGNGIAAVAAFVLRQVTRPRS